MKFDWIALGRLITMLSNLALMWFREVNGGQDPVQERNVLKAVSIVLDPDTPEHDVAELEDEV